MSVYNFAKFTGRGKSSKFSNGVVALGAAVAVALATGAASARTIGVTENRDANGVLTIATTVRFPQAILPVPLLVPSWFVRSTDGDGG